MADCDGMVILEDGGTVNSGGVFVLDRCPKADFSEPLDSGWTVEARKHSQCVVARGPALSCYEEARNRSLETAQRGLDLCVFRGIDRLTIVDVEESHVTWWAHKGHSILRIVSIITRHASMSATATVIDRDGNVKPEPSPVPLTWHDSFRYFRLSQTTNDLFDAYRNLYLALESILSDAVPKKQTEREGTWLKRAFKEVHQRGWVDFSQVMHQPGDRSPWNTAWQDLYKDKRNAIFHAKNHLRHLLPHSPLDRDAVLTSLNRLVSVYRGLAAQHLGVRLPSGGLTPYAFKKMTDWRDDEFEIHVTDDDTPIRADDTKVSPGGKREITLVTRAAPEYDRPFLHFFLGALPVRDLAGLSHIGRIDYTCNNRLLASSKFEGSLTLDGMEQFEVLVGIRVSNVQQPRKIYNT